MGIVKLLLHIVYPALVKIGIMWLGNQLFPAQEHMISNLVKRKLYVEIDKATAIKPNGNSTGNRWLLFLPGDETHETGLLFGQLLLLKKGSEVIYLGERVPVDNLVTLRNETEVTHILYFINTKPKKGNLQEMVNRISDIFSDQKICVSGTAAILDNLDLGEQTWLKSPHDLMEMEG